jgi:hypothetical protein
VEVEAIVSVVGAGAALVEPGGKPCELDTDYVRGVADKVSPGLLKRSGSLLLAG